MHAHRQILAGITLAMILSTTTQAGTLENMERERALLIDALLSSELSIEQRQRRLIDLERMVLRDQTLV